MRLELDHLVVAARTLDEGVGWCEATLDVTPGPGGKHPLMGTHNRLLRIASDAFAASYLEIIAIDPDAPPPGRARWFDLDRLDLAAGPRLVHAVARTTSLDEALHALAAVGIDAGRALEASRDTPAGRLQWRITIRDDGARPGEGRLPSLIEWGVAHPAAAMADRGVSLHSLAWRGWPAAARSVLSLANAEHTDGDGSAVIEARLATPRGMITLRSS